MLVLALALLLSGCVATVSTYATDAERAEFERRCADLNTEHAKLAEQASTTAAIAIGSGRFECERPRVWIRTESPPADPERQIPSPPVMQRTAEDEELAARHRKEADDLRRVLKEEQSGRSITFRRPVDAPTTPPPGAVMRSPTPGSSGFRLEGTNVVPVAAQPAHSSATPPDNIKLVDGRYPDQKQLGKDTFQCLRIVGFERTEELEALVSSRPATNQEAVLKLRRVANWMECMNNRGYVVPME